jgi:hypothetical protein
MHRLNDLHLLLRRPSAVGGGVAGQGRFAALGWAAGPLWFAGLVGMAALPGCGGASGDEPEPVPTEIAPSNRNDLQWKRHHAVQQDLMQALALDATQVCTELGERSCTEEVHLVPLGGHDPFGLGLYESLDEPLVTTPLALDRVVLSACGTRVDLDEAAGQGSAVVFTALDLAAPAPAGDTDGFRLTVRDLYRRLLARDPAEAELEALRELTVDDAGTPVLGAEFAKMACFAIGTTTEFLLF